MILYQVVSTYQLLSAIVHKVKLHNDDKCVLVISTWLAEKFPQYKELSKYFCNIVVIDNTSKFSQGYPKKEIKVCSTALKKAGLNIKDFEEIHVMGCHHYFAPYLIYENIPFYFWEDAAGLISRPQILENVERSNTYDKTKYKLCIRDGLYNGKAKNVIKIYCNYSAQEKGFDFTNTIDFSVVKELMSLDNETKRDIMSFFTKVSTIDIEPNSTIYLTQHFSTLMVMNFDENLLINQLVLDYFFENEKVVIKPHPDDVIYHDILFPECKVVREKFPSEFLPLMFNNKPKCIATISSTALYNLKDSVEKTFWLGNRFEKEFYSIHKYAIAMDIKNKIIPEHKIDNVGAMQDVIDNLDKTYGNSKNVCHVVDDIYVDNKTTLDVSKLIKNAGSHDVIMFINSKNDYAFYDITNKSIWNNIVPITITKTKVQDEEFYADEEPETIYIYSKDKDILNSIKKYSYHKTLKHTGLDIKVDSLDEEDFAINVLDGLRYATEHMLAQTELVYDNVKDDKDYSGVVDIDESKIKDITFSDKKLSNDKQNKMRVLEGIVRATEQRILYYKKEK